MTKIPLHCKNCRKFYTHFLLDEKYSIKEIIQACILFQKEFKENCKDLEIVEYKLEQL